MTPGVFDDKKKGHETKHVRDEEALFRATTRAVRRLGAWAAGEMGIAEAAVYAETVVDADFDEPGIQDVLRKLLKDFADKGVETSAHHIENQFRVFLEEEKKAG